MIDIHCHILHSIDDGATDLPMAVEMCATAQENDIRQIIATPHINCTSDADEFIELRDKRIKELQNELIEKKIDIEILPGAEVFVDDDIFFFPAIKKLTLCASRYILIEFAFDRVAFPRILKYVKEIFSLGLIPIIAHPERYTYFQKDYKMIEELSRHGVLFQINASSLSSLGSRAEFELSYSLARNGFANFLATDAHSLHTRKCDLKNMMRYFPPDISQKNMAAMVDLSAAALIAGEKVEQLEKRLPNIKSLKFFRNRF